MHFCPFLDWSIFEIVFTGWLTARNHGEVADVLEKWVGMLELLLAFDELRTCCVGQFHRIRSRPSIKTIVGIGNQKMRMYE